VNYRARTLKEWVLNHLRDVYREGSDPVRALLLQDSPEGDDYRSVPRIDAIVAFIREASTPFDQFLVKNYGYSVGDLNELRGLNFLFDGNFGSAVEALRLAGNDTASRALNADPFTIRIRDCHYCDASAPHKSYTKVSFAEGMLDLSRRAQGRGEDAALASFELANGLYNMSFYGNARDVYDTSRLNLSPRWEYAPSVSPAVRTDLAEKYYLQAAALSSDRELKTKATFMAAKAEQTRSNDRTHFRTLQQSYSNTAYYQEIIRECGYFRSFLGL
jgi:hypothetical protein